MFLSLFACVFVYRQDICGIQYTNNTGLIFFLVYLSLKTFNHVFKSFILSHIIYSYYTITLLFIYYLFLLYYYTLLYSHISFIPIINNLPCYIPPLLCVLYLLFGLYLPFVSSFNLKSFQPGDILVVYEFDILSRVGGGNSSIIGGGGVSSIVGGGGISSGASSLGDCVVVNLYINGDVISFMRNILYMCRVSTMRSSIFIFNYDLRTIYKTCFGSFVEGEVTLV